MWRGFLRKVLVSFVFTLIILVSTLQFNEVTSVDEEFRSVDVVKAPSEVYSGQPAFIFANMGNYYHDIKLSLGISICLLSNGNLIFESPSFEISLPMLSLPWSSNWYVAAIPGLPAKSVEMFPGITLKVTSKVSYSVVADGLELASGSYEVKEGEYEAYLPPFVWVSVSEAINNKSIFNETLGLGPRGWCVGAYEDQEVLIIAFDDESIKEVSFEYSVSGGEWRKGCITKHSYMDAIENLVNTLNDIIQEINSLAPSLKLEEIKIPIKILSSEIPGHPAGNYVMFRAGAIDNDGSTTFSPMGLYFIVNKQSNTRVLIIDPHIQLWTFQESFEQIKKTFEGLLSYQVPEDVLRGLRRAKDIATIIEKYGIIPFHHWEHIGKRYNLYITWPNECVVDLLKDKSERGFEPDVIYLSNLWLGLNTNEANNFWNWDLNDIKVDGKSLAEYIGEYVKKKHAGLIASHGTISDWVIWTSSDPNSRIKICTKGHVRSSSEELIEENNVASLLGMPLLTPPEAVRDYIAEMLCSNPNTESIGLIVGSMPLQVPYVPFDGVLEITEEAKELGWSLPEEFTICIPSIYNEFGYNAYTEVGWQLSMPWDLANKAWQESKEKVFSTKTLYNKLSSLIETIAQGNYLGEDITTHISNALSYGIQDFYESIISSEISESQIKINVNVQNLVNIEYSLDIGSEILNYIFQLIPTKVIATSKDGLAGVVAYDRYWDENGYRAVYFSFEAEAINDDIGKQILTEAIEWTKGWKYETTELLGGLLRVPKPVADAFHKFIGQITGNKIISEPLLITEEGYNSIKISVPSKGYLHIIIAHPTSEGVNIEILSDDAAVIKRESENKVTAITIRADAIEDIKINIRSYSGVLLNPVYVEVKFEAEQTSTPTPTPTPTTSPTPTLTSTPSPTPKPTKTVTPTSTPTPTMSPSPPPTQTPQPTKTSSQTIPPTETPTSTESPIESPIATETPSLTLTPTPTSGREGISIGLIVGVVVAIVAFGIGAILVLRRR